MSLGVLLPLWLRPPGMGGRRRGTGEDIDAEDARQARRTSEVEEGVVRSIVW